VQCIDSNTKKGHFLGVKMKETIEVNRDNYNGHIDQRLQEDFKEMKKIIKKWRHDNKKNGPMGGNEFMGKINEKRK
jgi:hypothetical protein